MYTWAQNCASGDAGNECRQYRQEFRDALGATRQAANNLEEGSKERQKLEAILDKYGDEGEKNKVSIAFGPAGGYPAEQSTNFLTRSNKITFDMKMINSTLDRNQKISPLYTPTEGFAEMVTHEGSHMLDKFFFGNPVNREGSYRTEFNAFTSQSYVPMGLNSYSAYGFWNPSSAAADKETLRSKAVLKTTEDHVNEMWDKKK